MNKGLLIAAAGVAGLLFFLFRRKDDNINDNSMNGKYFTIDELCKSETATKNGLDNTPNSTQKKNLSLLIHNILDPVREKYGSALYVNSGFRTVAVNEKVGGASNSQHLTGQAADIRGKNGTKEESTAIMQACIEVGKYDQLIIEKSSKSWWVHVSYSTTQQRGQILYYNGSSYTALNKNNWKNCLA